VASAAEPHDTRPAVEDVPTGHAGPGSADVTSRWWEVDDRITHRLAGVFEGGGAKGVAYLGALRATRAAGCWFGAVAGASAGAITAALVAGGLDPDDIGTESDAAFGRLRFGPLTEGVKQLRLGFGYVDNAALRDWLEGVLARQVARFTGRVVDGAVTFHGLYEATRIELNVVAADISLQRQVVFSVWDTPAAQVADAVMASSSIPFAFPPAHLSVPGSDGQARAHTLVDGGVWSNFPMFVFASPSFRQSVDRPRAIAEDYLVGYILDEGEVVESGDFKRAAFVDINSAPDALEWHRPMRGAAKRPSGLAVLLGRGTRVLLLPITLVLAFWAWLSQGKAPAWRGRWPTPKNAVMRWLVERLSDSLSGLHSGWVAAVAAGGIVVGSIFSIHWLIVHFLVLRIDELRFDLATHAVGDSVSLLVQIVLSGLGIIGIVIVAVLSLAALAANWVLLGPARQILYGVATTYVAGPGAPAWIGAASDVEHVIRLPIPMTLTTLAFDRTIPEVGEAVARAVVDAETVTRTRLAEILQTAPNPAPESRPSVDGRLSPTSPQTPSTTPAGVAGMAFALRLSGVAVAGAAIAAVVAYVLPTPASVRYDTGIVICAAPLLRPDGDCSTDRRAQLWANAIFGQPAEGHETYVRLDIEPGGRVVNTRRVRGGPHNAYVRIDRNELCGGKDCTVVVNAVVDGKVVDTTRVSQRTAVSIDDG
jgi:hypothetical protein